MLLFTSVACESISYHMYRNIFIVLYVNSFLDLILWIKINVFVLYYLQYTLKRSSVQIQPNIVSLILVFWSLHDMGLDFPFASSCEVVCIKSRGDELEKQ